MYVTWLPLASSSRPSFPGSSAGAAGMVLLRTGGQALAQLALHTEDGVSLVFHEYPPVLRSHLPEAEPAIPCPGSSDGIRCRVACSPDTQRAARSLASLAEGVLLDRPATFCEGWGLKRMKWQM